MAESLSFWDKSDPFSTSLHAARTDIFPLNSTETQTQFKDKSTEEEDPLQTLQWLRLQVQQQEKQIGLLKNLNEFSTALANITDKNLAIHQVALRLHLSLKNEVVAFFRHNPETQRLDLFFPYGPEISHLRDKFAGRWEYYSHNLSSGVIGKAVRTGKIQSACEVDPSIDLLQAGARPFCSLVAAPVFSRGMLEGVILLADTRPRYFDFFDITFITDICAHFSAALGRISYLEHEQLVVHATTQMVESHNPRDILRRLAELTLETTGARMAIAAVYDEGEWLMVSAGQIDQRLMKDGSGLSHFFRFIADQQGPFPLQDYHNCEASLRLDIEDQTLRAMLACPFSLSDYVSAQEGVLVALGKTYGSHFSSVDETLIQLLANNAVLALDYSLTKNDLRANAERNRRALTLSLDIARSIELGEAARRMLMDIKVQFKADAAGLVLVDEVGETLIDIILPEASEDAEMDGVPAAPLTHPIEKIGQVIQTREHIVTPLGERLRKIFPIKTQERCYGALWLESPIRGTGRMFRDEDIRALINQTAVALESSIRNARIQSAYRELNRAYTDLTNVHSRLEQTHNQLSETFKQTILGLMRALEAREKETAEHNIRMEQIAVRIGQEIGLNREDLEILSYGALMHDIGKIGVPDGILLKQERLSLEEREIIKAHAGVGATFIENIPGLHAAAEVIANHHELWNGSGYPRGLAGDAIPLLARIVTIADVFDALTHDRPYRGSLPVEEALQYLTGNSGILFDPKLVSILVRVLPTIPEDPTLPSAVFPH